MVALVGILNITPDSFSDGGQFVPPDKALDQAKKLFRDGASIVDVGAESTRPGATVLTADEEWMRLEKVLPELARRYPGKISLDSYHPETIERAFAIGPVIVNDVTGFCDPAMQAIAARHQARVIVSHLPGSDIQQAHRGKLIDDIQRVTSDLLQRANELIERGLPRDYIILDPGIGFGKTPELNRQLLSFAREVPDYPVMIGYSRKRFLGENRMESAPNLEAGREAITSGATYLRVHDVLAHAALL